jgi:succinate dehydrogenase/fumarate reductase flavoprotein subunit
MGRVVVIGAGLAGICAAYAAARAGARVVVADRGAVGRGTNSAMANAFFAGPTSAYGPEDWARDTVRIGRRLNRPAMVEAVARAAPEALAFFRPLGLELVEHERHYLYDAPRPDAIRGALMMQAVARGLARTPEVQSVTGFQAARLAASGGRVLGVAGWGPDGRPAGLAGRAVVLATGGAAALYARNDNVRSQLGQGYALAARAGLPLWDLEFVQFYPLVLAEPGLPSLMLYPPYPPGARLLGPEGEDLLEASGIADMDQAIQVERDRFALAVFAASQEGPVRLDYSGVAEPLWRRYPLAHQGRLKWDFRSRPVRVAPGAHFCMGGVAVDRACRTGLEGLYAAGEAVWGLHGANRRGGNALLECLATGLLAGRAAAAEALAGEDPPAPTPELARVSPAREAGSTGHRRALARLRELAWRRAGMVRAAPDLRAGLAELEALEPELAALPAAELHQARRREDLLAAALVLRGVLAASLARAESRGSFQRADHPRADDRDWLASSRLAWRRGALELSHHRVGETPPELA